jgi:hypothetical protein
MALPRAFCTNTVGVGGKPGISHPPLGFKKKKESSVKKMPNINTKSKSIFLLCFYGSGPLAYSNPELISESTNLLSIWQDSMNDGPAHRKPKSIKKNNYAILNTLGV